MAPCGECHSSVEFCPSLQCPQAHIDIARTPDVVVRLLEVRAEPLVAREGQSVACQHVQVGLPDP